MNRLTAMSLINHKLQDFDRREHRANGLPPLEEQDLTWAERRVEMWVRLQQLSLDERPSMDLLASLGAHVLATMLALDAAEEAAVDTGDAA